MRTFPTRRWTLGGGLAALAARPALVQAPIRWPHHAKGAVSLTYDDGLDSQLEYAVPQLQRAGFKATFFLVQENMEARLSDWKKVARLGHEIGDHTEHHPCDLEGFSAESFQTAEIDPMERFLDRNFGRARRPRVYAYPCGYLGLGKGSEAERFARYGDLVGRDFAAARTTAGGPIDPHDARRQRLRLPGFEPTYDADVTAPGFAYLEETIRQGRWAILVFHDVTPTRNGEGGASMAVHKQFLDYIARAPLWCAPMGRVFDWIVRHDRQA